MASRASASSGGGNYGVAATAVDIDENDPKNKELLEQRVRPSPRTDPPPERPTQWTKKSRRCCAHIAVAVLSNHTHVVRGGGRTDAF